MWELYADHNKGMVLEYDLNQITIPDGALWKVNYTNRRGSTSVGQVLASETAGEFAEVLSYKTLDWAYEEEWRLLSNTQGVIQLKIPLRRVLTGPGMVDSQKTLVANAIVRARTTPRFAQLAQGPRPDTFRLCDVLDGTQEVPFV
jgi:Protein of unknown function (DUF2971)